MKKKIIVSLLLSFIFALTSCTTKPTKQQPTSAPISTPIITVNPTEPPISELTVNFIDAGLSTVNTETSYIGNIKSKKFHRSDCHTLPAEKNRIELSSRDEAINAGYSPCENCQP